MGYTLDVRTKQYLSTCADERLLFSQIISSRCAYIDPTPQRISNTRSVLSAVSIQIDTVMGGPSAVEVVELVSVEARGGTVHGSDILHPGEHREAGAAVEAGISKEGELPENVQGLSPVDGGWHAWRFVASGFVVEVMVWGFQFRSAYNRLRVLLVY